LAVINQKQPRKNKNAKRKCQTGVAWKNSSAHLVRRRVCVRLLSPFPSPSLIFFFFFFFFPTPENDTQRASMKGVL
jgi:hypothetical protein